MVRPDPIEDGPTKYFYNFTGMGGPEVSPRIGDHDYLDCPVGITARDQAPVSWGGMSGGGAMGTPTKTP